MYKDPEKQKEANRLIKQNSRKGVTSEGVTGQGVTQYHSIIDVLIDPVKRDKLERIYQELKAHHVAELVSYGLRKPIPFDVVGELLEATR